jgi:adenylate cyclase class 2
LSVEAEIKARVTDLDRLHRALSRRADGNRSTDYDRYFDYPDRRWTSDGHELRVRTVTADSGESRVLLTFKESVVDADSGSKPEHETTAAYAQVLVTVLIALGVQEIIAFGKQCTNYAFRDRGYDMMATVVTIPELAGETPPCRSRSPTETPIWPPASTCWPPWTAWSPCGTANLRRPRRHRRRGGHRPRTRLAHHRGLAGRLEPNLTRPSCRSQSWRVDHGGALRRYSV